MKNTVTVIFVPLVAYYLDLFVLTVFLGNCILDDFVLMKNLLMKGHYPADEILLGVIHKMAAVCWHCVTVFDDSDPVKCWPHLPALPKITKSNTIFFSKLVHYYIRGIIKK